MGLIIIYIIIFTLDNNVGGVQLIFKGAHHNTPLSSQLYSSLYIYIYIYIYITLVKGLFEIQRYLFVYFFSGKEFSNKNHTIKLKTL